MNSSAELLIIHNLSNIGVGAIIALLTMQCLPKNRLLINFNLIPVA